VVDDLKGRPRPPVRVAPYLDPVHRAEVISLWKSVFGYEAAHNTPALAIDRKLAVQDGLFFVAIRRKRVVGTILAGYDGHRGWLYAVAVDPANRMNGIGTDLVLHAERVLVDMGCMKINLQILSDNESVAAFYQSLGYSVEPRISMGKRIASNIPGA